MIFCVVWFLRGPRDTPTGAWSGLGPGVGRPPRRLSMSRGCRPAAAGSSEAWFRVGFEAKTSASQCCITEGMAMGMGCHRNHNRKSNASLLAPFFSFWLCEKIYMCVYPQLDQQIYSALVFYMLTAHGVTVSVSTRTLKNDVILGLIKTKSF